MRPSGQPQASRRPEGACFGVRADAHAECIDLLERTEQLLPHLIQLIPADDLDLKLSAEALRLLVMDAVQTNNRKTP